MAQRRTGGVGEFRVAEAAAVSAPDLQACKTGRNLRCLEVSHRDESVVASRLMARIEEYKDDVRSLVTKHHGVEQQIFGSVARGDDQPGSDVDFLVQFTDDASLLDEIGLRLALEDLLQIEVDVVSVETLSGRMLERVLGDAVEV